MLPPLSIYEMASAMAQYIKIISHSESAFHMLYIILMIINIYRDLFLIW